MIRQVARAVAARGGTASKLETVAMPGYGNVAHTLFTQDSRHGFKRRSLAVDHECPPDRAARASYPFAELGLVRVGRIACEADDLGPSLVFLTKNLDHVGPLLD